MNAINVRAIRTNYFGRQRPDYYLAELGPLFARGKTEAEATRNLKAAMPDAIAGDWIMRQVQVLGQTAIVYRTPAGWFAAKVRKGMGSNVIMPYTNGPFTTVEEAIDDTLTDLAQAAYVQNNMHAGWKTRKLADIEFQADNAPEIIAVLPESLRDSFRDWVGFQRAYQVHRATWPALDDNQRHHWACEHDKEYRP